MTVKELKKELEKYDDNLPICFRNHVDFPMECLELKLLKGDYLETFSVVYEPSRCVKDTQFICLE